MARLDKNEERDDEGSKGECECNNNTVNIFSLVAIMMTGCIAIATLAVVVGVRSDVDDIKAGDATANVNITDETILGAASRDATIELGNNICAGAKPTMVFDNIDCVEWGADLVEQAGADVTLGYVGNLDTDVTPIATPYWEAGLCPVNVHWHLGAEHNSDGEYDEDGTGPGDDDEHRRMLRSRKLVGDVRLGGRCHYYDSDNEKYTTEYDWQHCVGMHVGETYEVHWPHSNMGACGTPLQYQTPFYDGVFCKLNGTTADAVGSAADGDVTLGTPYSNQIGVQAQIFTIINDEDYYYPDLMRGMIVDGERGAEITAYTGSTTGTTRSNEVCSKYAPITWHVDRKCHLISASTFDKMCADMKAQQDDMTDDLHAHGARIVVLDEYVANNQDDISAAYAH